MRWFVLISEGTVGIARPRVLVALTTSSAWSRGVLRGFMSAAHERGWTLLHYHPAANLSLVVQELEPAAAVVGPDLSAETLARLAPTPLVSVAVDRSAERIASVCVDEAAVGELALEHLLGTGLRQVSTFRLDESPFAIARERAFIDRARISGTKVAMGWGSDEAWPSRRGEDPVAILAWLRELPKPCGIFTITDGCGRTASRYARLAGLRVPEELALVGADNDVLECELMSPALSSVMIPWHELGRSAARLVRAVLSGQSMAGQRQVTSPVQVIARRSSDVLAIEDPVVARAVAWIRQNADQRLTVPMVARAVGGGRQRLERRFRGVLDRTVQKEIRSAHVERAKALLSGTQAALSEVAKCSGFTNASLMSVAFQREIGMPPGVYRRRVRQALAISNRD
jgi:LacI family transcriptional regulator